MKYRILKMNAGIVNDGQIVVQYLLNGSTITHLYRGPTEVYTVENNCYKCWVDDKLVIDLPPEVIKRD